MVDRVGSSVILFNIRIFESIQQRVGQYLLCVRVTSWPTNISKQVGCNLFLNDHSSFTRIHSHDLEVETTFGTPEVSALLLPLV